MLVSNEDVPSGLCFERRFVPFESFSERGKTVRSAGTFAILSFLSGMIWTALPADEGAAKEPRLKLAKGESLSYVVTRTGTFSRGENETKTTSEVTYKISVEEARDNGDLVLGVAYASVKAKSDSERRGYDFDSSKKGDESELATGVREAISGPIKVTIAAGDIVRIQGFPQPGESDDRQARGRQFRIAAIAGQESLRQDLELILGFAVHGKALEKGKTYQIKRDSVERLSGAGGGRGGGRRGFGFFGFRPDVVFKFEGAEKDQAKFSLSTAPRERPRRGGSDRPRFERKETAKGDAVVSLKTGTLASLSLDTKSETSGEFGGRQFNSTQSSKVTIRLAGSGDGEKKAKDKAGKTDTL